MKLYGEVVKHKFFGRGKIVEFANNYVTVLFDESKEKKKFAYPTAFGSFLELGNKSFLKQIEEDKKVIAKRDAESKRINEERAKVAIATKAQEGRERNANSPTAKSSNKNNIAFKCNYCDGGRSKEVVGYKGVCSDDIIKYNTEEMISKEFLEYYCRIKDVDINSIPIPNGALQRIKR